MPVCRAGLSLYDVAWSLLTQLLVGLWLLIVWPLSPQQSWQPSDQCIWPYPSLSDFLAFPFYVLSSQRHGGLSLVPVDVEVFALSPHSLFRGLLFHQFSLGSLTTSCVGAVVGVEACSQLVSIQRESDKHVYYWKLHTMLAQWYSKINQPWTFQRHSNKLRNLLLARKSGPETNPGA